MISIIYLNINNFKSPTIRLSKEERIQQKIKEIRAKARKLMIETDSVNNIY